MTRLAVEPRRRERRGPRESCVAQRAAGNTNIIGAMIDATAVVGTPGECRDLIEAYRQSGIDLPIISPFARGAGAKATFEAAIRACAPA